MPRSILEETSIHPAVRATVANHESAIVDEVKAAIAQNKVVVVGMRQNPVPKKARKLLTEKSVAFKYLEYGSYFNNWRRRNALKLWSGWPTFPMIFVAGQLIGGYEDLEKLVQSGEFDRLLNGNRNG